VWAAVRGSGHRAAAASSHASRVQAEHKLHREVDTCAYTGNGGFTLIGRRLQGSHPDWEPFTRKFPDTLDPDRIYVEGPASARPLPLWPVARAEVCDCAAAPRAC
jgi:type I restriction enzyme M protein